MKILIIGAGIAGLALANRLQKTPFDVTIIEQRGDVSKSKTGVCLPFNAVEGMRKLGLYTQLMEKAHQVSTIQYAKADGEILSSASLLEAPLNKGEFVSLLQSDLLLILLSAVTQSVQWNTTVKNLEQDDSGVTVTFNNRAESEHYDLVIAADGIHSKTRQALLPNHKTIQLGISTWRFVVNNTRATPEPIYYLGKDEVFIIYPLPNNKAYCYGHIPTEKVKTSGQGTSREALLDAFSKYSREVLHKIHQLSEDNKQVITGELESVQPSQAAIGRVILIGDAFHGCPPVLQQGVGMSLEDIHLIADLLLEHSIDTAIKHYEELRLPKIKWVVNESNRIIHNTAKGYGIIGRLLRNAIIRKKGPINVAGWRKLATQF